MARYINTDNLKEMCRGTRNQWRLISAGVICSRVPDTEYKPRSGILYRLETPDQGHGQAIQRAVAVI